MTNSTHTVEETVASAIARKLEGLFPGETGSFVANEIAREVTAAFASHSTPAGEDVERVANAIHVARFGSWPVLPMDATDREYCERLARAAITALPAPSTHDELVEALDPDVKRRLLSVCDTLENAKGQAFAIDFHNLASDIRAALTKMGEKL